MWAVRSRKSSLKALLMSLFSHDQTQSRTFRKYKPRSMYSLWNSSLSSMLTDSCSANAKIVKTDYSKDDLLSALKGQDAVISLVGRPGLGDPQAALIDAAAETGVQRFLPSEFGHNTGNDAIIELVPALAGKRKSVDRIKSHPKLTFTSIITGLFFDWSLKRASFIDLRNGTATVYDDGDVPFSTTNLHIIGETLVKLLTDPAAYEDSKNRYIYLASHTTTQNEIVDAAEKATGKTFEIKKVSGAEKLAEGKRKLANGDPSSTGNLLWAIAYSKINGEALADFRELGIFNDKYGVKDVPLEEDVKKLVASL